MGYVVETDAGASVDGTSIDLTEEQSQASMDRRNVEAERLGLKTKYRIRK